MAREVNEKEFWEAIGELDVTVTPKGEFPYRTDFCLRNGKRIGYIQDEDHVIFLKSRYYLDE